MHPGARACAQADRGTAAGVAHRVDCVRAAYKPGHSQPQQHAGAGCPRTLLFYQLTRQAGPGGPTHPSARPRGQASKGMAAGVGERVERVQTAHEPGRDGRQQQAVAVYGEVRRVQRGCLLACMGTHAPNFERINQSGAVR